jgi:hypothetical protein
MRVGLRVKTPSIVRFVMLHAFMPCVRGCVCNIAVFYLVIMTVQCVTEFNTVLTAGANNIHNNIAVKLNALIC